MYYRTGILQLTMNEFGGNWTEEKIAVFIKYVKAYLQIMKTRPQYRLFYFDGFAGSGLIGSREDPKQFIQGVATKVLAITEPRGFHRYFFVEKKSVHAQALEERIQAEFPDKCKKVSVVTGDCNEKLAKLAAFMKAPSHSNVRTLAFIDPYGMQLSWNSIAAMEGTNMDVWILVPTGVGVGRLLKNDGLIDARWMARLVVFLGMAEDEIKAHFYTKQVQYPLFGNETVLVKQERAAERAGQLYRDRIISAKIFRFVSAPLILRNSKNAILYHFILCSNNAAGLKIANDITKI